MASTKTMVPEIKIRQAHVKELLPNNLQQALFYYKQWGGLIINVWKEPRMMIWTPHTPAVP